MTKAAEPAKTVARQCTASETAAVLPFVTTANTARDMDRIRAPTPTEPTSARCTRRAATGSYFELAERLDRAPAQGYDGTTFRTITAALLRSDAALPALAKLWHRLDVNEPESPAAGSGVDSDNFAASYLAVVCGDSRWPGNGGDLPAQRRGRPGPLPDVRPVRGRHPAVRILAFPVEPRMRIIGHGPANVLLLQNLRDPATPMPGALRLRAAHDNFCRA